MKFLVLGSSGQIGAPLSSYLRQQGHSVLECDLKNGAMQDLRNPRLSVETRQKIRDCDFVFFLASDVGGAKYLEANEHSYSFIINNLQIMANTFEALREYKKPFIYTSSQMADLSHSTYGMMKLLGEKMTRGIGGLPVRFWNVYGPEKEEEKAHVITDFCKMAKEGIIRMRTDGRESRQFLYVEDCCEALLILAKKYKELDKTKNYHISSFEWVTVQKVAEIIADIKDCAIFMGLGKDKTQMNSKSEPDPYILNFWQPKTSLKDGIAKIYGS